MEQLRSRPGAPGRKETIMKKLTCSYLYADGHAVLMYEKEDKDAGRITFCEIYEKWTNARLSFTGRLIFGQFDQEMLKLAKRATSIVAHEASIDRGSDNTKKLGIPWGSLEFRMSGGYWGNGLHFSEMPGLISGPYTYQPKVVEVCPSKNEMYWAGERIAKFHPATKQEPTAAVAA